MARGNNKQSGIKAVASLTPVSPEEDIQVLRQSPGMKYWLSLLEKYPVNGEGEKATIVRNNYQEFLTNLRDYQSDESTSEVRKTYKVNAIKAFLALPEPIRNEIMLPKEKVGALMRGGSKPSNPITIPGKDGLTQTVVASFTSDKAKADFFARGGGVGDDRGIFTKIYTAADIESFDGIIDVNRAYRLKEAFNGMQEVKDRWAGIHTLGGNRYTKEHEFLVYGIKWKEGVA